MKNLVIVKDPHPCSMAAGVLLKRRLRRVEIREWLKFRKKFIADKIDREGALTCFYCGKTNLVSDLPPSATKSDFRNLATIDHVRPKSRGGKERDITNLVVACYLCNQKKADLGIDEIGSLAWQKYQS